jgi:5-methylcytosine-specific restriction protein A
VGITEVTKEAILAAVAEHDALGAETFLKRYGYAQARSSRLAHGGHEYDSKAIVGAAHGYLPGRSALKAEEFPDETETVVSVLRDQGFEVRERRSPPWLEAELILACALVAQNQWKGLRAHEASVIELSKLLQSSSLYSIDDRGTAFRSPNSVQRKTFDIATQHPEYKGKPTRGGKLDLEVLQAFLDRPAEMHAQAEAIRAGIQSGELLDLPTGTDLEEVYAASEGRLLFLRHLKRERDPKLRADKISNVMAKTGCLECEVCDFDFERTYGERGAKYAEVHHVVPLHVSGPTKSTTRDLAVLCANCHRMIHRGKRWLSPDELRDLVNDRRAELTTGVTAIGNGTTK